MTEKVVIIALTENGRQLAHRLNENWQKSVPIVVPKKIAKTETPFLSQGFKATLHQLFKTYDALICIMATGIVVRSLAEVVNDKLSDPAILVMDEAGKNVISLLSGHVGGGNRLTLSVAEALSSHPVITTATDVQDVTALDVLAKELNGWYENEREMSKWVNGLLASHQEVGIYQEISLVKDLRGLTILPNLMTIPESMNAVIVVSDRAFPLAESEKIIQVVPKVNVLGIGARKDIAPEIVQEAFCLFCTAQQVRQESFRKIVSIDVKKEEAGILALAEQLQLPFETYTKDDLVEAASHYPQSEFVKKTVGVGNVALAATHVATNGQVKTERFAYKGVTLAYGKE